MPTKMFDARTASVRTLEKKAQEARGFAAFVRNAPPAELVRPVERDGARILRVTGGIVFSGYREQTMRTWQTIEKVVSH